MPKALVQRILEKPRYSIWERAYIQPSHNLFRQVAETSTNPVAPVTEEDVFGTFSLSVTVHLPRLGGPISITIAQHEVKT